MSDPLRLRPARPDDLAAIVRLLDDGRGREDVSDPPAPEYLAAFAAIEHDERTTLLVAEGPGGAVVGTLQVSFLPTMNLRGGERAQIEGVFVDPAARGRGVGRALIGWAVQAAAERGCRLAQLTTNKERVRARAFYESLGFVASHEGMKLTLEPADGA